MERIVVAYSGGLDTSVAIRWLAEQYSAEIVSVTLDIGQGRELADVRERALALGAVRAHVIDAREEFVTQYLLPALQAGALYEDRYPLATALARPLVAKRLVEVAKMERATAVAHGCRGKGNDQIRLDVSARALDPSIKIIAPARMWEMSPAETLEYAHARDLAVPPAGAESAYSIDANLWGRSIECGVLEDPWAEPPEDIYQPTRAPQDGPDEPAYVEIGFESGVPVTANGIAMSMLELIESLDTIAGAHGVGRIDMVENRLIGIKSREVYEAPAALVLHTAHRELERFVIARDLERLKHDLGRTYADLVYNGLWFSPLRRALQAFVDTALEVATGEVSVELYKGRAVAVGRTSPQTLYRAQLASFDMAGYRPSDAEGFIRLFGLPLATAAQRGAANRKPDEVVAGA